MQAGEPLGKVSLVAGYALAVYTTDGDKGMVFSPPGQVCKAETYSLVKFSITRPS